MEDSLSALDTLLEDLSRSLCDPISLELIADPVVTTDGLTYDRQGITEWFEYCRRHARPLTSPVTNRPLASDTLIPNVSMKCMLDSTMKYLNVQDAQGLLYGKGKEILERHREYEQQKRVKHEALQAEERRLRGLNVFCGQSSRHRMSFQRQHTFPHTYRQQFTYPTVNCDHCARIRIQEHEAYYFHCAECGNYDLCHTCGMHMHEQSSLPPVPRPVVPTISARTILDNALLPDPDAPDANEFGEVAHTPLQRRLHAILARLVGLEGEYQTGNSLDDDERDEDDDDEDHDRQFPAFTSSQSVITPTAISPSSATTTATLPFPRISCSNNREHRMEHLRGHAPPSYLGTVTCDRCNMHRLELDRHLGYLHCAICRYDLCRDCWRHLAANAPPVSGPVAVHREVAVVDNNRSESADRNHIASAATHTAAANNTTLTAEQETNARAQLALFSAMVSAANEDVGSARFPPRLSSLTYDNDDDDDDDD